MAEQQSELKELKKITGELKAVKANTGSSWTAFWRGVLQGAGAIVGGILTVALIGMILSIMGVIPGFQSIAASISAVVSRIEH